MRPLHHQVELNPPELSFRVGVAHSGGDPLGDAPEHPGESPVQGAGSDPAPFFARSTVRARVLPDESRLSAGTRCIRIS